MYLWDMQQAALLIVQFTTNRDFADYQADVMLRSAVERQFEIIGEALSQLRKLDPMLAAEISDYQEIIGFRNVLIHGYSIIDHEAVWKVIETKRSVLLRELDALLNEP
jgi:uncharacterized protein with HEPN domain